ncbi:MAG TPA: alpha/beta fold hydrolase [Solirubrobacteraceae bacterium]|nr:alpha/beta fold hydrolase [Solirubrobacteraceae bacterium]
MASRNSTSNGRSERAGNTAAARAALDVMLTDAAVSRSPAGRFLDPVSAAKFAGALARHPLALARRAEELGAELARVATGSSELTPAKSDRRFGDRAWNESWLFRRLMQSYLAVGGTVQELIDDADLDWQADLQVRFTLGNVLDVLAPTNLPLTNPTVLKETIDRGGANVVRGGRRLARDISKGRLPAMVDTSKFEVGGNLAVTPGSVVLGTDVFELIQYKPQSEQVYEVPIVIMPPTINKYYVLDLAPGRSVVEYLLTQGHQVFMVSWRNPDREQGHFDLDAYAEATIEAGRAAAEIAGHGVVNLTAACSGGIITAAALGHLAAEDRLGPVSSLTLMVCAIDNKQAGTTSALATKELAATAVAESARKGYLDGESLARVFAWLRPNDLIWNYVINNYWLGKEPPAFDILYWNQDTVRLSAGLHRDFVMLAMQNSLARPGASTVLGTPVDLGEVTVDSYIVAGSADHIVPWRNAYASTQLLGGQNRFVLSASGHIQALINPPSPDSRSSYQVADEHPADPDAWLEQAVTKRGSWWPDYTEWLSTRSGELKAAPAKLGRKEYKAQAKAPGTYVHAS